jgi:hypothetical protein
MEQGYHATSMRQIAERADLALGGIYNHFASKEDIFEAIIMDKHPYKKSCRSFWRQRERRLKNSSRMPPNSSSKN